MESIVPPEVSKAVYTLALAGPRMLVALALLPYFSHMHMTRLMVAAVSSVLVFPVIPAIMVGMPAEPDAVWLFLVMAKESAIGLVIGFAVAIPFWAADAIGDLIENQRGSSNAHDMNPGTGEMNTSLGLMFALTFNILFLIAGGMGLFLTMMYDSYLAWPVSAWTPTFDDGFARHVLGMMDSLVRLAVMMAAPAIIAMLMSELALAFISLFAPQMQVFFLAMPIKSGVAVFIILVYLHTLAGIMMEQAREVGDVFPALQKVVR